MASMKLLLILLPIFCFLLILVFLPLPIPPYLDFQVIYHADMGLLRGIPIYDHAGQVNLIAALAHVSPDQVIVLPFPYPPWYALMLLPLALLPISMAARLWFGLNLLMLFASIWLLTGGWGPRRRLAAFPLSLLFWPILGALFVGQYGFPVLLGAALFGYGLQNQKAGWMAIAAALLTFKPHLGLLILLAGLLTLVLRRSDFGRRAWMLVLVMGVCLFVIGFLASPLWPLDYFHSLTGFKEVSQCHQCNNVSMLAAGLLGGGFGLAVWIAAGLLILSVGWLIWIRQCLLREPFLLVASMVLIILLVSPYLQNYDYILVLVPLLVLAGRSAHWVEWLGVAGVYLLPDLGLGLFGVPGQISLILATLLAFVLLTRLTLRLDVSPPAAYNPAINNS